MPAPLVVDALIEEAANATGLDDFGAESYREGLDILVADYNAMGMSEDGRGRAHGTILGLLQNRLKVLDYLKGRPELLDRPVERPVFVMGVPRTGTTLLSNLLACDPARRSALTWEIDDPVPPATTATLTTDPRALARLAQERAMIEANPAMWKYYRLSAVYPNECIYFMASDFKALALEARGKLPNYRDWLFATDMTSAYDYHRKFLQLLQADAPGVWNLKMPSHALWLDTIRAVYPDARFVWTHRDPLSATGSLCSVIGMAQMGYMGRIDTEWLAENCSWQTVEHADRVMDFRDRVGEDQVIDVHYADLVTDPIGAMRRLYAALGDAFTPEAEAAMQGWIDDNPQGKFGKHEYRLEQYGLSAEGLTKRFERYLSRYDVAREG